MKHLLREANLGEGAGDPAPTSDHQVDDGRPEYIPEKFWDNETQKVMLESWGKSHKELEGKLRSKTDDLRSEIEQERMAQVPESYVFTQPELELPDGIEINISEDDPILQAWNEIAKSAGLTQEHYNQGIQAWFESQVAQMPNRAEEMEKLGDRGQDRIESIETLLQSKLGDKGFQWFQEAMITAEGIEAVEELIGVMQKTTQPSELGDGQPVRLSQGDLDEMMADPRYWDPVRRDPKYVERVTRGFEQLYGDKPFQQAPGPINR